jgi:hypothetical protein
MNSIIEAHNEFIENYNEDSSGFLGLLSNHRKVTKIKPEVALYCFPNYRRSKLTTEDRLLFLLQERFGIKNTELIKKVIPEILELTDPDFTGPYEYKEQAIEMEPDKFEIGLLDFISNLAPNTSSFLWHEASMITKADIPTTKTT